MIPERSAQALRVRSRLHPVFFESSGAGCSASDYPNPERYAMVMERDDEKESWGLRRARAETEKVQIDKDRWIVGHVETLKNGKTLLVKKSGYGVRKFLNTGLPNLNKKQRNMEKADVEDWVNEAWVWWLSDEGTLAREFAKKMNKDEREEHLGEEIYQHLREVARKKYRTNSAPVEPGLHERVYHSCRSLNGTEESEKAALAQKQTEFGLSIAFAPDDVRKYLQEKAEVGPEFGLIDPSAVPGKGSERKLKNHEITDKYYGGSRALFESTRELAEGWVKRNYEEEMQRLWPFHELEPESFSVLKLYIPVPLDIPFWMTDFSLNDVA